MGSASDPDREGDLGQGDMDDRTVVAGEFETVVATFFAEAADFLAFVVATFVRSSAPASLLAPLVCARE